MFVEDFETLRQDPVELGRRMARSSMSKFAGRPSEHDIGVSPSHIIKAVTGMEVFSTEEQVEDHLAAIILSVLRRIPDKGWCCDSRWHQRTNQFTLGLLVNQNAYHYIPEVTQKTYPHLTLATTM